MRADNWLRALAMGPLAEGGNPVLAEPGGPRAEGGRLLEPPPRGAANGASVYAHTYRASTIDE